jgi:hypothetical protein
MKPIGGETIVTTKITKRRTKKMNNELLFVVYVGVKGLSDSGVYDMLRKTAEQASDFVKDHGKVCVVPSYDNRDTRIECINPTFISDEELREETKKKVDRLIAEFEKKNIR